MVVCRKSDPFSTILYSKFSLRISSRMILPVALHMSSILIKFQFFQNSLPGVPRSPNFGTLPQIKSINPFNSTILFSKLFRRISFKRFLLLGVYTPSTLTKFHLSGNSLAGVSGSSNLGTRLNMVVCRQK